jgi:hypothetical protein
MPQSVWLALGAVALVALAFLVVDEAVVWLDQRSRRRAQRIERGVTKVHERLAKLSQLQATLLDAHAHEAAVALILASYRASKEACDGAPTSIVAKNTATSSGAHRHSPAQGD